MALQSSGTLSLSDVNVELGNTSTDTINLNSSEVRDLFGVASGLIRVQDGYGKSNGSTQFSIAVRGGPGETIIPWDDHPGLASTLMFARRECAGETIESWSVSDCSYAGESFILDDFLYTAFLLGYDLQTTEGAGASPLEIRFAVDIYDVQTGGTIVAPPTDPNVTVNWGDGTTSNFSDIVDNTLTHSYGDETIVGGDGAEVGNIYNVSVKCTTAFKFNYDIVLHKFGETEFVGANPVTSWSYTGQPTDTPNLGTGRSIGKITETWTHDITGWDTSNVTNMYRMFMENTTFNQDISAWDVSNVTNMANMFLWADSFNQDIGSWDVSNVTWSTDFRTLSGLTCANSPDGFTPSSIGC